MKYTLHPRNNALASTHNTLERLATPINYTLHLRNSLATPNNTVWSLATPINYTLHPSNPLATTHTTPYEVYQTLLTAYYTLETA